MVAISAVLLAGCKREAGEIRERSDAERARAGMLVLADSSVVADLKSPVAPGRIIYDPPVDLSYANAQRTRPDLVRGDTVRRDTTTRPSAIRDTTGGDAAADTSGGAARPRRP
jgi:hypothetical protein